jgi:pyrroloquinoline quinone biosynthesis protein B
VAVVAVVVACGGKAPAAVEGPRLRVLGTAQDGGLPHVACRCARCEAARVDPTRARRIASLGLVGDDGVYLVDATPDIRDQLAALSDVRSPPAGRVDRTPVDGVLLTHAHLGHYTGLAFLGFEAGNAEHTQVWATPRMGDYLRDNGPWQQLVQLGNVQLQPTPPEETFTLGTIAVTPIAVPHRDEYSDTVAFRFTGARATVLYMPDTEPYDRWSRPLEAMLEGVDVALLDGTFYSPDELPGRPVETIGHPLITDTMDRLQSRIDAGELRVLFTHLNHSNPASTPGSPARAEIERRGFRIAEDGMELPL